MHARTPRPVRYAVVLTAALTAALTLTSTTASVSAPPSPRPVASADDAVDHVVAISIDGLNPNAIRTLGESGTPALHRLMREGASTLNARSQVELTITLPNHTGMVTGRRINAKRGGHGVTFNEDNGTAVHRHAREYVASMFDVAHDNGLATSLYTAKDKFNVLDRSWTRRTGARDRTGANNGRDKIDRYHLNTEPANTTRLIERLKARPDGLSFVHIAYPDRTGHEYGFMSPTYLSSVQAADEQVGRILDVIAADPYLNAHTNVILTSDHGGTPGTDKHSERTNPANYTVPFMVWGTGIPGAKDLYTLNAATRRDPGTSRPGYTGTQPIRNGEVANLALDLLDLPAVDGSLFNKRQNLAVR
jgi:predicted AlkP superfamily pyrophosphatase or phosphodiesterase